MTQAETQTTQNTSRRGHAQGAGQLSLIEHALCPLAAQSITAGGGLHQAQYWYTDQSGQRRTAQVRVLYPLGLTPTDEFYLWGLLALTLSQKVAGAEFHATPHYCLRQLGVIDQHARRGGRQYAQFAQALERLSAVTYQNDAFYDPLRREHRRVAFGFLSYSLPLDPASSRAWRIVWDAVFLEFANAIGGHLWFDLAVYRQLDPASRRLFLLVSKLFRRQRRTPAFDLQFVGQEVLGFAKSLPGRDLKVKVKRCIRRLASHHVVAAEDGKPPIRCGRNGADVVQLVRGPHFERRQTAHAPKVDIESPLAELMQHIGLNPQAIQRCLARFPTSLLQQWLDITLAAREKYGASFFKKSEAAYFVDNVQKAAQNERTPPDWWHDLVRDERRAQVKMVREERASLDRCEEANPDRQLLKAAERQFRAAGQSAAMAVQSARQLVACCRAQETPVDLAALLKLLT